jgi:hypothetical protein
MKASDPIWKNGLKIVNHPKYNYIFNTKTGLFIRWGKSTNDDPILSPLGPEILDIEVSTICSHQCPWC